MPKKEVKQKFYNTTMSMHDEEHEAIWSLYARHFMKFRSTKFKNFITDAVEYCCGRPLKYNRIYKRKTKLKRCRKVVTIPFTKEQKERLVKCYNEYSPKYKVNNMSAFIRTVLLSTKF